MTEAGAVKISRDSFIYMGDIIASRWRVTADRWSSLYVANGRRDPYVVISKNGKSHA